MSIDNTIFTGSVSILKGDVISGCFMGEFYSGVNIVGMIKETIEVDVYLSVCCICQLT